MKSQAGSSRRVGIFVAGGIVAALAVAYGLEQVFSRPSETSLRYIPADAAAVVAIDLTPGTSQVVAFKSISDSLKRNGLDKNLQDTVLTAMGSDPLAKELRPLIKGGGALYVDGSKLKTPTDFGGFLALSLTDSNAATQALKTHGPVRYYKGLVYVVDHQVYLSVLDDQLLLGNSEKELYKAKQVKDGDTPGIAGVPEFQTARKEIAADSNFVCYVSGKSIADLAKTKSAVPSWMSFGISVRDGGLQFTFAGQADLAKNPEAKAIASAPAIRSDLFDILPSGSYGVAASSDIGAIVNSSASQLRKDPTLGKDVVDFEQQVKKSTGLSIEEDLSKACAGDGVLAVYPTDVRSPRGVDVLVVEDDKNGSDPADEFRKYEAYAEKNLASSGPKMFVQKPISGGDEYLLADKFVNDIASGVSKSTNGSSDSPIKGKTIAIALIGKALIASSSQALLDRAVASYESKKDSLSGDPNYAPYLASVNDGSHNLSIVSLSRIAEAIKGTLAKTPGDPMVEFLNVVQRLKQPLTVTSTTDSNGLMKGTTFIPMDYAALIDAIGKGSHAAANRRMTMR